MFFILFLTIVIDTLICYNNSRIGVFICMSNLYFQVASFFTMLLVIIVYFSKKVDNLETRMFAILTIRFYRYNTRYSYSVYRLS